MVDDARVPISLVVSLAMLMRALRPLVLAAAMGIIKKYFPHASIAEVSQALCPFFRGSRVDDATPCAQMATPQDATASLSADRQRGAEDDCNCSRPAAIPLPTREPGTSATNRTGKMDQE